MAFVCAISYWASTAMARLFLGIARYKEMALPILKRRKRRSQKKKSLHLRWAQDKGCMGIGRECLHWLVFVRFIRKFKKRSPFYAKMLQYIVCIHLMESNWGTTLKLYHYNHYMTKEQLLTCYHQVRDS